MNLETIFDIELSEIDNEIYKYVGHKWDTISKPLDGFGDFELVTAKIHAINRQKEILSLKKAVVIFCADNGIVEEGVSQCSNENTYLVAKLLGEGKSSASTLAKFADADIFTVDVGIDCEDELPGVIQRKIRKGTRNFLKESAMTKDETLHALEVGIQMVRDLKSKGYNIIAGGEMGIGNTTTTTALLCALTGFDPEVITGRGAGLSDKGLLRKKHVIAKGLEFHGLNNNESGIDEGIYALEALSNVGGYDIAALTGLFLGGAMIGMPIIIDGAISAVAALVATKIIPECKEYMIPSHAGKEKSVQAVLDILGFKPFINGNMAFGEGTGAIMLYPILDMVFDYFNRATTFSEGNIEQYERHES